MGRSRMTRFQLDPMIVEEEGLTTLLEDAVLGAMGTGKKDVGGIGAEHIEEVVINLDDDDGSTLVGAAGDVGQKEIEMEVDDNEDDGDDDVDSVIDLDADLPQKSNADGTGIKRKRTIRVIIRSRAFL